MKIERTRDLQGQRTDREKSNKIAIVEALPNKGFEGDEIYRGTPPEQVDRGEGFYKRLNGKWVFIGGFETEAEGEHAQIEIEDTDTGIRVRGKSGGETAFGPWQEVRDGRDGQDGKEGEDAEIEVEDTDTGIRVRGKSGGEPNFGPWHDVRDGRDGQDGKEGEDAEIEVENTNTGIRVRGKSGGESAFGPWHDVRDGRDGQDGDDGDDGEEGEDAEIEVENTNTGIRVRGKSGGESAFGPWHDVRDGRDGQDGDDGEEGEHAEIEVEDTNTGIRVRGKSGGETDFGPWHDVRDGRDGKDGNDGQDGEPGQDGNDGRDGDDGWSPKFATVSDGERRVLQVADWFGGGGTKPNTGQYIGATGFVTTIGEGVDIRGPAGEDGTDADLSHLVVNTRGVLIATSSFLPEHSGNSDRVLDDVIQWTLNTDSGYAVYGTPTDHSPNANANFIGKFTRGAGVGATGGLGILNVPYKKPAAAVNGLWFVCEDLADPDTEIWEVFIPWGGGSLEDDQNSTYFDSRYILHWGREENSNTTDGDDVTVYFSKRRGRNFKSQISIKTYRNERMPSTQCRVKVYLAGVFLTVTETE